MSAVVRPSTGGFIRPFGCGWFIREFLLGHGPESSPKVDPDRGSPQADIKYQYKEALYRAIARDRAEREISDLVNEGVDVTSERAAEIERKHFRRIPFKMTHMRYHSFTSYFHKLIKLGWVEFTGEEEPSEIQDNYPPAPSRRYYRLTEKGKKAPDWEWSNPLITLYPQFSLEEYYRDQRAKRKAKQRGED